MAVRATRKEDKEASAVVKRVLVVSGDGRVESVSVKPGLTTEVLKRLLALPSDVDIASDGQGRVLLPDEDLSEVLDEGDVLRTEPAAHLGSVWADLLVLLCVSALVLPRVLALYRALQGARASKKEETKTTMPSLRPPSSTAVLIKGERCILPLQREVGARPW